jgi:two-component system sensor histidine kinase KdpD
LVDEFPHTDVPGSGHTKRWEDVVGLLDAGIDVLTTMNIQHLESLNDQIWNMTGVRVRETIPDWVVKQANEVVMVDLTPRALLNRLERGVVYPPAIARRALQNFFKESTLVALRELALRQAAYEVESRHVTPLDTTWGETAPAESEPGNVEASVPTNERLLVHMTEHPSTAMLIRRGKRVADYLRGECFAVYVRRESDFSSLRVPQREAIEKHLNFARNLHIETRVLEGTDIAGTLIDFARLYHVTQIFIARPQYSRWQGFPGRNLVHRIVRKARDMQVTVVAERRRENPM